VLTWRRRLKLMYCLIRRSNWHRPTLPTLVHTYPVVALGQWPLFTRSQLPLLTHYAPQYLLCLINISCLPELTYSLLHGPVWEWLYQIITTVEIENANRTGQNGGSVVGVVATKCIWVVANLSRCESCVGITCTQRVVKVLCDVVRASLEVGMPGGDGWPWNNHGAGALALNALSQMSCHEGCAGVLVAGGVVELCEGIVGGGGAEGVSASVVLGNLRRFGVGEGR